MCGQFSECVKIQTHDKRCVAVDFQKARRHPERMGFFTALLVPNLRHSRINIFYHTFYTRKGFDVIELLRQEKYSKAATLS